MTALGGATFYIDLDARDVMRQLRELQAKITELEKPHTVGINADTRDAQRAAEALDRTLDEATADRTVDVNANTAGAQQGLRGLMDLLQRFQRGGFGDFIGGLSEQFGGASPAGNSLFASLGRATAAMGQIGMAIQGVQAVAGTLKGAIDGLVQAFAPLTEQAARFNQQLLSTATTAAMFNEVKVDGQIVKDPTAKIQASKNAILPELKALQADAAFINGATTAELVDIFQQVVQNNVTAGDLTKARKLTASLAAGMNTFGIPGWQAQSELMFLLSGQGNVADAQLARSLGIGTADIRREKAKGTYFEFLQEKLEPALAGQKLGADTLTNVQSNIQDVFERMATQIGQPIEQALTQAFKRALSTIAGGGDQLTKLGRTLAESFGPLLVIIGDIASSLISIGRIAVAILNPIATAFAPIFKFVFGGVGAGFRAIAAILEAIANIAEGISEYFSDAIEFADALFSVFFGSGVAKVNEFWDGLVKGSAQFKQNAIEAKRGVQEGLVKGLEGFLRFLNQNPIISRLLGGEAGVQNVVRQVRVRLDVDKSDTDLQNAQLEPDSQSVLDESRALTETELTKTKNLRQEQLKSEQAIGNVQVERLQNALKLLENQRQVLQQVYDLENKRLRLAETVQQGRVNLAGTEEQRARESARLEQMRYQQQQSQLRQSAALLDAEGRIQAQQLRIQQVQIQLKEKELRMNYEIAKLENDRVRRALQDAQRKNRPESEIDTLRTRMLIEGYKLQAAQDSLGIIGAQTEALNQQRQVQGQILDLRRQGLAIDQQINTAQFRSARTQQVLQDLENRRQQALGQVQQQLEAQRNTINEQVRLRQSELDKLNRSMDVEEARRRLADTTDKGEISRLEQIQRLLQERPEANTARQRVIDAQLRILGAERDQVAIAERLAKLRMDMIDREEKAALEQLRRKREELRIQREIANLQSLSNAVDAQSKLATSMADAQAKLALAKRDEAVARPGAERQAATQARANLEAVVSSLREREKELGATFATIAARLGGATQADQVLKLFRLPSLSQLRQGEQLSFRGLDTTLQPTGDASNGIVRTGGSLGRGATVTARNDRDAEQTGSDIAVPGGSGGAVRNPFERMTITGRGFQGRGRGPGGRGYGNWITGEVVIGGKRYEVLLGHLDKIEVNVGDVLEAGALLGRQGTTGRATGPHVTTHVNAKGQGATRAGAQQVLERIEDAWANGRMIDTDGAAPSTTATAASPSTPPRPSTPARSATSASSGSWRRGTASWYGPGFYGNRTASGFTYNPTMLGVASRNLPFGTIVEIRYGNRTAVAEVVDYGPSANTGRDLDLMKAVADKLNITRAGVDQVSYRVLQQGTGRARGYVPGNFLNLINRAGADSGAVQTMELPAGTTPRVETLPFPGASKALTTLGTATTGAAESATDADRALRSLTRAIEDQDEALRRDEQRQDLEEQDARERFRIQRRDARVQGEGETEEAKSRRQQQQQWDALTDRVTGGFGQMFDAFTAGLSAVLSGSEDWGTQLLQALSNVFRSLANDLLASALEPLKTGLMNLVRDGFKALSPFGGEQAGGLPAAIAGAAGQGAQDAAGAFTQLGAVATSLGDASASLAFNAAQAGQGLISAGGDISGAAGGLIQATGIFGNASQQLLLGLGNLGSPGGGAGLLGGVFGGIGQLFGGLGGGGDAASIAFDTGMLYGPAFADGGIVPGGFRAFAGGGIVDRPTLALMGEGGRYGYAEAVIPLPDGKTVPVSLNGNSQGAPITTNISVNVSNSQSESTMTGDTGNRLARTIDAAVRAAILKEQRAGGLLQRTR